MGLGNIQKTLLLHFNIYKKSHKIIANIKQLKETSDIRCKKNYKNINFQEYPRQILNGAPLKYLDIHI